MTRALIFDTETTGKPPRNGPLWDFDPKHMKSWPHLIQLAAKVVDGADVVAQFSSFVTLPEGVEVPKEKFFLDQGYTTESVNARGLPQGIVLSILFQLLSLTDGPIVCHNTPFDIRVLYHALAREQPGLDYQSWKDIKAKPWLCTMRTLTPVCKLPSPYRRGEYKWPTLSEAYAHVTGGETLSGAHDAMVDVDATHALLLYIKETEIIMENFNLTSFSLYEGEL